MDIQYVRTLTLFFYSLLNLVLDLDDISSSQKASWCILPLPKNKCSNQMFSMMVMTV